MRRHGAGWKAIAFASALGLLVVACGDDDDVDSAATTEGAEADSTTDDGGEADFTEVCDVANEMNETEDFPTADQVERYQEVAPEELQDAIQLAGDAIIEGDGDPAATFAALAEDDVA